MKLILISPKNRTVYNFRGDLVQEMIRRGYEVIVTGPDQTDVERIRDLGASFCEIPMNKTGTNPLADLRYCRALYRLIKREKPAITLGYTIKPVVYGSIAARLAGVKNINGMVTGGGYVFTARSAKAKLLGAIVRLLYRAGFSCCRHVIFQNPDDQREFCALGLVREDKCGVVNGSGVNMERFRPSPMPETVTFFMLSRLLKSKGVAEYLEAARMVKREYPQARFWLLGKYEVQMQDALSREQVEPYLADGTVERFDETSDVRPYYGGCTVYVLPSYREGTPRTVLEAMAMGRPVITTDTNGCRETVTDGVNGFLVPVRDPAALAEKMRAFLQDPDLAHRMGQESLTMCREKFEVGRVNQRMLELMEVEAK